MEEVPIDTETREVVTVEFEEVKPAITSIEGIIKARIGEANS